jgi:GNAT superfamily N-acetyltransferase
LRRELGNGYELDDDRARVDVTAVHAYLSGESYWARGRPRALVERALDGSWRVVGLYHGGSQIGCARVVSDGATVAYLADVYVLEPYRGQGFGRELVREALEGAGGRGLSFILHTADAGPLYERFGFKRASQMTWERGRLG